MQSRARRLSTGLTIAIVTGTATVLAAPAADAAPNPLTATCGSMVTGTPGTPVALRTAGPLYDAVNVAAVELANTMATKDSGYQELLSVPEKFRDLGTIGVGSVGSESTPLGSDAVARYVLRALQDTSAYQQLQAASASTAGSLSSAVYNGVLSPDSGAPCSVTMSVRTVSATPKPKPADKPVAEHSAGPAGGRDREISHPGSPARHTGSTHQVTPARHASPQPVGAAGIIPVLRAGRPGEDIPSFTDASGGLFRPPGSDDPAVTRTGEATPLAMAASSDSGNVGIALILAVLALSGVGAAVVRTWAVRRVRFED